MNTPFGKSRISPLVLALVVVMVGLVGYLMFAFFTGTSDLDRNRAGVKLAIEMREMVGELPGLLRRSSAGESGAYEELQGLGNGVQERLDNLASGYAGEIDAQILNAQRQAWGGVNQHIGTLVSQKDAVVYVAETLSAIEQSQPELIEQLSKVVETLLSRRVAADQVAMAQAQLWRAERLHNGVAALLVGADATSVGEQISRDATAFQRVLAGFVTGDAGLGISKLSAASGGANLERIAQLTSRINRFSEDATTVAPQLLAVNEAREAIYAGLPVLLDTTARLADSVRIAGSGENLSSTQLVVYAGIFLILGLAVVGMIFFLGTRDRLKQSADAHQSNQDAILRLLDEIEGLGEGDLTAEVSVTEGFTGAIADAINLTIVQLRELVSRIVDTATRVSSSASETRSTVLQLTGLSEHQAEEIAGASAAINEMAITIDQVSANAAESATVADRSVSIANKGAEVVRSTISGMDSIREQIQDTSKRIKRLGESSQEIGDIVSLINDIADQTNILALNAAIQASMAGDAGRGFAVVADEVQRLAERSANATKQIAALVKTIQTDTNEAVSSMEQTTAEVVSGASLTENAGIALSEIETVSTNLAELIQDISTAARHQSTTAGHISKTMNVIQDITTKTLDGTNKTSTSVGELTEMAVELRESVSGFKLPKQNLSQDELRAAPLAAKPRSSWLDDRFAEVEEEIDADIEADMLDEVADLEGEDLEAEDLATPAPARFQESLAENSAAMEEIDRLSEITPSEGDFTELETASAVVKKPFGADLEAELASIDLDEFDLEQKDRAKTV